MRPNPYIVHMLKYATLTLIGCGVIVGASALFRTTGNVPLAGRLTSPQERGIVPTMRFEEARAIEGFSAPADTHVIFTVPQGVRIPRVTFLGGPDYDEKRYWGYCFSGNEAANKQKGYLGKKMYDGQFFYSIGERKAQVERPGVADNNLQGILDATTAKTPEASKSMAEIFYGGQTCYVMSSIILPVAIDSDGDDLNAKREQEFQTDPHRADSDGDGIPDGLEVFKTKTLPGDRDTDHDGLGDRCEDKNMDGQVQKDETSPLVNDTDRDGLCDGNGSSSGCPEPRQIACLTDATGERVCDSRPSSPIFGEDMNQDCHVQEGETDPKNPTTFGLPDWDYKWNLLQAQTGNRRSMPPAITDEFPIPDLPVE